MDSSEMKKETERPGLVLFFLQESQGMMNNNQVIIKN